jgi:hypothetical protein
LLTPAYKRLETFRKIKEQIQEGNEINTDSLTAANAEFYNSYVIAGDYLYNHRELKKALYIYKEALTKEMAAKKEKDHVLGRIKKINFLLEVMNWKYR